jgi:hypothetical protein
VVKVLNPVAAHADTYLWKQVPVLVERYVTAGATAAHLVKTATSRFPVGSGGVLLAPLRGDLWVVKDNKDFDYARWEKLASLDAVNSVHVDNSFPDDVEGWVFLKQAGTDSPAMISDVAKWPYEVWKQTGRPFGGHSPVTGSIAGAALGGLGGYGLGKLLGWAIGKPLGKLFPKQFSGDANWWAPMLGVAGAGLGGGLPLWAGLGRKSSDGTSMFEPFKQSSVYCDEDSLQKQAGGVTGAFFRPTINAPRFIGDLAQSMGPSLNPPLDAFGGAVVSNSPYVQQQNLFGTKNTYGHPAQDFYTPAPAAGTMAGLVSGAAAGRGSSWVSPMDIARVAMGAGAGLLSGVIVGKIAGGLAGLRPDAQKTIQRVGLWGGLLTAAAKTLF